MTVEEVVAYLVAQPKQTGLFLDFDGTLAPIVEDPERSRMPEALQPVVAEVAGKLRMVALVSGRPARFLAERARATTARMYGVYGLEEWSAEEDRPVRRPEAATWVPHVAEAREALMAELSDQTGLLVEDKGLGVAVHWRNAVDREAAAALVERAVHRQAERTGLGVEAGKLVLELRPPVRWDKGSCVRAVADEEELERVAYVGDDLGDLPAFAAVRNLGGCAVAVDHGDETPDELRSASDLTLEGPAAVSAFLESLAAALPNR